MANQIALLLPHLGGKAYSLRSAIVHAIGSLLHKAFDRSAAGCFGRGHSCCWVWRARPWRCSGTNLCHAPLGLGSLDLSQASALLLQHCRH